MNIIELVRSIADKDKVDPWTGQEDMATLDKHELELLCATVRAKALDEAAKEVENFGRLGDSESRSHAEAFAAAIRGLK